MDTSSLTTQIASIIEKLHVLYDEIGVFGDDRQIREQAVGQLLTTLSETLNSQLHLVKCEKNELRSEASQVIKSIEDMRSALGIEEFKHEAAEPLQVTFPLMQCLTSLGQKKHALAKTHSERVEQVKKTVEALESYSSHLEPSFLKISLPSLTHSSAHQPAVEISKAYLEALDKEFSRVYEEYRKRIATVGAVAEDIVNFWAELGVPQAQTESNIVQNYRDAPEQLGLRLDDIERLHTKRDRLRDEKRDRERKITESKMTIEALWDRFGFDTAKRKNFLTSIRGCGMRVINDLDAELDRLNELKRQNLHLFVEDVRYKLQELWDELFFSEEEMLEFTPAFSDVYSDALLSAHEAELSRLDALREQRAPTLDLINKHRSLLKDREELSVAAQDGSRLLAKSNKGEKRDPTRLLREEKMRKRIAKDLPKVEAELRRSLAQWEVEYARPFLVHGSRYLDQLKTTTAAKTMPPRSKTPVGPPPGATSKKVPLKMGSDSRAGSVVRNHTSNQSMSCAGTTTPASGFGRCDPLGSSVCTTGGRTPSRIPARVPLGNMQHGGNSPERQGVHSQDLKPISTKYCNMAPPTRAPPPRMRDLFNNSGHHRPEVSEHRNERLVSMVSFEEYQHPEKLKDPYEGQERMSYAEPSSSPEYCGLNVTSISRAHDNILPHTSEISRNRNVPSVDTRQISTNSTTSVSGTAVSGSENWETFDDASEAEPDYAEAFDEGPTAVHHIGGKRFSPEGGHISHGAGPGKKFKAMYRTVGEKSLEQLRLEHAAEKRYASRSESAWTDEGDF